MAKRMVLPLVIEDHPKQYSGYPFITLIQFFDDNMLTIVDNLNKKFVFAFVLDLCGPGSINETELISIADQWYQTDRFDHPLSVTFSRLGMTNEINRIYRRFNLDYIRRMIGPIYKYDMFTQPAVRRRKRKDLEFLQK